MWTGRQLFDARRHPANIIVVPLLLLGRFVAVTEIILGIEWFVDNIERWWGHCHRHIEFPLWSTVFTPFGGHHLDYIFFGRCICTRKTNEVASLLVKYKAIQIANGNNLDGKLDDHWLELIVPCNVAVDCMRTNNKNINSN